MTAPQVDQQGQPADRVEVDAITLAVISGTLGSTVRQMTITLERTARSPLFKLGRDYSNAIFDAGPRMVLQGADLPIHLGSLLFATKSVASYFGEDVRAGDVFYHNDPATGGGHLQDMCMMKPIFHGGHLVLWAANKAHMEDTGGPVPGGYNPLSEDIYAEGLRITPLRIYDRGVPRRDVLDLICGNVRTQVQQRKDMDAQLAALSIAERRLIALLDRYGTPTARAAIDWLLDIGEQNMRAAIRRIPDGVYRGSALVEDDGRLGELRIDCTAEVQDDEVKVSLSAPPQVKTYINSYWANTIGEIYYGVLCATRVPPPYNEGLYRPIRYDLGPSGSLVNAAYPAACSAATGTVGDNIGDAVRDALSKAMPEHAMAGWAHPAGTNQIGVDPRTGALSVFNMIIGTSGGAGATWGLDGWHCLGLAGCGGGMMTGDVELLEHEYPVHIHRYELRQDSGGAGRWRGGLGPVFEEEPLGYEGTLILRGEGYVYPAAEVLGARSRLPERKVVHKYLLEGKHRKELPRYGYVPIRPGQRLQTCPAGGGGVGDPLDREIEAVRTDALNELISIDAARQEYGVVINPTTFEVDLDATERLRGYMRREP